MVKLQVSPRFWIGLVAAALLLGGSAPAHAYTPGSGTLFTANFEGALDADWEQGNGSTADPWTQVADGGDTSFYADGRGPYSFSPTRHWARHFVSPVAATTFSIACAFRADLGATYTFDLEVNQRAPALKRYRLRVDGNGALSLWRSENGVMVQKAATANGLIPVRQNRWLRFAVDAGAGGHPRLRARVWSGSAGSEPASWNLEATDELDTLARVHNFELTADGPKGIQTWLDDLDAFGDKGAGIASSVTTIYVSEWTHLDIGFTLPPDDIETYAKTHLDQVLQNLAADPAYYWTIESSWYLERWWERSTDTERAALVNWMQNGRIRLAAGYANLHTTTAGPEELTRNIYYASRFAREHQVPLRFWITDDVPGTSWAVPEILARSGIEYFFGGMNTPFGGKVTHPNHGDRPFWWQGPDGSKVLAWTTFDAYGEAFDYGFSWFDSLADMYRKLGKKLPEQEEAGYRYPELMLMRAFDNNYAGWKARDMVNAWNATYATPHFELTTPDRFMDLMRQKYGDATFPTFSGDYGCAWSPSHADAPHVETWVREAHRKGRAAEALLATGSLVDGGAVPQAQVDLLYRNELQVDEHSGAGGWPGYWNAEQLQRNNTIHVGYAASARDTAAALLDQGLDRTVAQVPAAGDAVVVVNSLVRSRDGWVRVALPAGQYGTAFRVVEHGNGLELPYQRFDATSEILFRATGLPALGYKVYDLVPGAPTATPAGTLSVSGSVLENDFYRIVLDTSDGSVSSLVERATGRQLVDTSAPLKFGRLASLTWQEITGKTTPHMEPAGTVTITIDSAGPLMAALRVARTGSPLTTSVVRLYRGEDRVEIANTLDRSLMPYVTNAVGTRAYVVPFTFNVHDFQIRSESTTRFLDPLADGFPRTDVFDYHNVEHTLAFWDANGGIWYAVDGSDAHFFEKLSSLASSAYGTANAWVLSRLWDRVDEYKFADNTIGPFTMEPGTGNVLTYTHHVRGTPASFDPAAASRWGYEALNAPLAKVLAARGGALPGDTASFFAIDAPGVVPYTVKRADDGDGVIVRMTELTGQPTTVRLASGVFELSDPLLTEQDEENGTPLPLDQGAVVVSLTPYRTATVRVRAALPAAPLVLGASRNAAQGAIHLLWTGGHAPFTLRRAEDPQFSVGVTTLVDHQNVTEFDDPVLNDGKTYFYEVH